MAFKQGYTYDRWLKSIQTIGPMKLCIITTMQSWNFFSEKSLHQALTSALFVYEINELNWQAFLERILGGLHPTNQNIFVYIND